jgi:hypothetical protein
MLLNKMTAHERKALFGLCALMLHNAMANSEAFVVPLAIRSCITSGVKELLKAEWVDARKMRAQNVKGVTPQQVAMAMMKADVVEAPQAPAAAVGPSAADAQQPQLDSESVLSAGAIFTTASKRKYKVVTQFDLAAYLSSSPANKCRIIAGAVKACAIEKIAA